MDVSQFLTWQFVFSFVFLSLATYAVTLIIRTIIESVWAKAKDNKYWNEIFLPLGGIVNGALLGVILVFMPLPDILYNHFSNRIVYGMICGLFTAFVYNRIKSWIKAG